MQFIYTGWEKMSGNLQKNNNNFVIVNMPHGRRACCSNLWNYFLMNMFSPGLIDKGRTSIFVAAKMHFFSFLVFLIIYNQNICSICNHTCSRLVLFCGQYIAKESPGHLRWEVSTLQQVRHVPENVQDIQVRGGAWVCPEQDMTYKFY